MSRWRHNEGKGFVQGHSDTLNGLELGTSPPQASCSGATVLAVLSIDDLDLRTPASRQVRTMVTASAAAIGLLSSEAPAGSARMAREQAGGVTKFKANILEDLLLLPSR